MIKSCASFVVDKPGHCAPIGPRLVRIDSLHVSSPSIVLAAPYGVTLLDILLSGGSQEGRFWTETLE